MTLDLPSSTRDFLARWAGPEGPLAPVRSVWLEFDPDRAPVPVLCAKLPRDADPGWITGTLLPLLQGQPLPAGQRERILACLEALPAPASLLYVFSLLARGSGAVRLEIFGLEPDGILRYLQGMAPETIPAVGQVAPLFAGV